jgi:hypothetical protein
MTPRETIPAHIPEEVEAEVSAVLTKMVAGETRHPTSNLHIKKILEKTIEAALIRRVTKLGGLCEKFVSPGRRSVPDRLVTLPGGRIIFVEVKAPGKGPTELQERDHWRRRKLGCEVIVINTIEEASNFK